MKPQALVLGLILGAAIWAAVYAWVLPVIGLPGLAVAVGLMGALTFWLMEEPA